MASVDDPAVDAGAVDLSTAADVLTSPDGPAVVAPIALPGL
jgi:hypothetical protein